MKKKLTLNELQVESFTTKLENGKMNTAKGGATLDGESYCISVVSEGYWTVCCFGDDGLAEM